MKRTTMCLLTALALASSMGPDWIRPRTRPGILPGVPERDYQALPPAPQPPARAVSFDGVEVVSPTLKLRTFAMSQRDLRVNHCSISEVVFMIGDDGRWAFNCRADQNPWFTTEPNGLPPKNLAPPLKIETNYLLRNEFFVTVRCYGNFPVKDVGKTTGKPALAVIGPIRFMVQRGEPRFINMADAAAPMQQFYKLIDRVEFELSYR